jgi:hypothetical protein
MRTERFELREEVPGGWRRLIRLPVSSSERRARTRFDETLARATRNGTRIRLIRVTEEVMLDSNTLSSPAPLLEVPPPPHIPPSPRPLT